MAEKLNTDELIVKPDEIEPFPLTDIDREILATRDEDYHRITWEDLKQIIASNSLESLKRLPSDLRKYLAWSRTIKMQHGGITPYVISHRLHWNPLHPSPSPPTFAHTSPIPFASPQDFAILLNDWPYGFTPDITHLLVWSKTPIATDLEQGGGGDVTDESRSVIEEFVQRTFVEPLGKGGKGGKERVLWFKNWVSLQSVRGVDHVHVLVRDAPRELVEKWTERKDL